MLEQIKEWAGPVMAAAGIFGGYVAGKERTRARITEVSKELAEVQKDLRKLGDTVNAQSVQLAAINANLEWLKANAKR